MCSKVYEVRFNCLACKAYAGRVLESNQILRLSPFPYYIHSCNLFYGSDLLAARKFYAAALGSLIVYRK